MNDNIDWNKFFENNTKLLVSDDTDKLIRKIVPYLWIDKSISDQETENAKYFLYYVKLLKDVDGDVQILDYKIKKYPYYLIRILEIKKQISCIILKMMNIKYKIVDSIENDTKYLLPIGSITHDHIDLTSFTGIIIKDDELFNFIISDPIVNDILLKISLLRSRVIEYDEILTEKFHFINI